MKRKNGNQTLPQKLVGVALPLNVINAESVREKSICNGCPNSLHLWGAIRSFAQSSAVLSLQQTRFDNSSYSCYKLGTSPLFLRGQGARRLTAASAFLMLSERSITQGES
jgi:hypothetical protein